MRRILQPKNKNVPCSPEDIASAISLRSVSPKAYRYLRLHKYPLPALSTLRKWASTFSVEPGVLHDVIRLMHKISPQMTEMERLCILSFDEIYVSNRIDIENNNNRQLVLIKAVR